MNRLPRNVIVLGFVSLFTDFSSEMIYPLLPVFLTTVLGASVVSLGLIEGVAETTASLLKIASGIWSDRVTHRKPFILVGYGLASAARPLIGLATAWPVVLVLRFTDRVGKGIRTSPRDALIADAIDPARRGAAFGFHRSMDHAGAVAGPLLAAVLLTWAGFSLSGVFLFAVFPALIAMLVLTLGVREEVNAQPTSKPSATPRGHWRDLGRGFHIFLGARVLFALGNSTDAFILLRLTKSGVPEAWVAVLWALHHVVKMSSSYWGGSLSDRVGRRRVILGGWTVYAAVYLAFGLVASPAALIIVFLVYGLYFGLAEPTEKAWATDLVPKEVRGTALGYCNAVDGLAALPASAIFGGIWEHYGVMPAFSMGAALAFTAALILYTVPQPQNTNDAP